VQREKYKQNREEKCKNSLRFFRGFTGQFTSHPLM
jgi:hypothetical protein